MNSSCVKPMCCFDDDDATKQGVWLFGSFYWDLDFSCRLTILSRMYIFRSVCHRCCRWEVNPPKTAALHAFVFLWVKKAGGVGLPALVLSCLARVQICALQAPRFVLVRGRKHWPGAAVSRGGGRGVVAKKDYVRRYSYGFFVDMAVLCSVHWP